MEAQPKPAILRPAEHEGLVRQVNGRFWFFYGALSDVEYTITVTDAEAGRQASYHNPPGRLRQGRPAAS